MKKLFLLDLDFCSSLEEDLSTEELGEFFRAIIVYQITKKGKEAEKIISKKNRILLKILIKNFEKNDEKYNEKCQKNKQNSLSYWSRFRQEQDKK